MSTPGCLSSPADYTGIANFSLSSKKISASYKPELWHRKRRAWEVGLRKWTCLKERIVNGLAHDHNSMRKKN